MYDQSSPFLRSVTSGNFLAGLAVGSLVTFVLTNQSVQRALFRTAAKTANMITSGVAEAKERFHDAEAEAQMERGEESPNA